MEYKWRRTSQEELAQENNHNEWMKRLVPNSISAFWGVFAVLKLHFERQREHDVSKLPGWEFVNAVKICEFDREYFIFTFSLLPRPAIFGK